MRIDGPKGLGSWLTGWFSGSFRGLLEGTASVAETASYVSVDNIDGLDDKYLSKEEGGTVEGPLTLSGSVQYSSRLIVHGGVKIIGNLEEGIGTEATEEAAHAEGKDTKALGVGSHAEGKNTKAIGVGSHAEGVGTVAIGIGAHAEGEGTIAAGDHQTVVGRYNIPDASNKYLLIVGNGTSPESRSNAFAVRADGGFEFGGGSETGFVVSGSTIESERIVATGVVVQSVDKIGKVTLTYESESDSLAFRFHREDDIENN